jgi:hypothetical protein
MWCKEGETFTREIKAKLRHGVNEIMSVLVGCSPVQWVGGARTVTGTVGLQEQRASTRPSVRCVVAVVERQTPICTATEF